MIEIDAQGWLEEFLPKVTALAREAGDAIMAVYAGDFAVDYKHDTSPLTEADLASHHIIAQGLALLTPNWPILSEEAHPVSFDLRRSWRYFWMVDPLDGTKEFLSRNGEFTVNIALMDSSSPVLGVVFAPAIDQMYYAAKGLGAFKANKEGVIRIGAAEVGKGTLRVVVSRSHHSHDEDLDRFTSGIKNYELLPVGSSLKFCMVADGSAHIYPRTGPTMEWDTAAAHCIVEEAGGSVTDLNEKPLRYNKAVLRNPAFVAKAVTRLQS